MWVLGIARSLKHSHKLSAIIFGTLAAMGYALQHPLTKPIASALSNSLFNSALLICISQIVYILTSIFILYTSNSARSEVILIYKDKRLVTRLFLISSIGIGTLILYLYAISRTDQVLLSVILNCYPMWSIVIGIIFFKEIINAKSMHPIIIPIFAVCIISIILFGYNDFGQISLPYTFLFSLIPILYSVAFFLRQRFFSEYRTIAFIAASQLCDAPLIISICIIIMLFSPLRMDIFNAMGINLTLYIIGAISSMLALYCLHKGTSLSYESSWLTSFMLFLVPSFTAMFSWAITFLIGIDLNFNTRYIYLVIIFSACLIIHEVFNVNNKSKEN